MNEKDIPFRYMRRWLYKPDMVFVLGVLRGMTLVESFRNSHASREDADADKVDAAVARLILKHGHIVGPILKDKRSVRLEALAYKAETAIEQQLRSKEWKERQHGVENVRKIAGMDAPTKSEHVIESPHLDRSPLEPIMPAAERLKAILEN